VKGPKCKATFFAEKMEPEACIQHGAAMWNCIQDDAGGRLDATPDPLAGAFDRQHASGQCQIEFYEQVRVSLDTFQLTPTGHVDGSGFLTAVD
jgi:hypothetical protein